MIMIRAPDNFLFWWSYFPLNFGNRNIHYVLFNKWCLWCPLQRSLILFWYGNKHGYNQHFLVLIEWNYKSQWLVTWYMWGWFVQVNGHVYIWYG
jgi:hypothetical protein